MLQAGSLVEMLQAADIEFSTSAALNKCSLFWVVNGAK